MQPPVSSATLVTPDAVVPTGSYPDDLGAAIQRLEFLLHGIMAGLATPVEAMIGDRLD